MLDRTLLLVRDGYLFVPRLRQRQRSDVVETRLMGQRAICMAGSDAAELFYDESRFMRRGAMPNRIRKTLIGDGGVQTLDDAAHRHRKAMFMSLMAPESIGALSQLTRTGWATTAESWPSAGRVVLFDQAAEVLLRAACAWAGVPLREPDVGRVAADLAAMVDGFGGVGPRHWKGRLARKRSERWIGMILRQAGRGDIKLPAGSAVHTVAHHRDVDGRLLDEHVAAVEILNLLRPVVAIAWYVVFAAHALHHHPRWRTALATSDDGEEIEIFVQEVRRFYPFTPFVGARVRTGFDWRGHRFRPGQLVLLDVYGNDHDARLWDDPQTFSPDRFRGRQIGAFDFIPQGGGDFSDGHRCAGERITIELTKAAVSFLTHAVSYHTPPQDLGIPLGRIPTRPRSGLVITDVETLASPSTTS